MQWVYLAPLLLIGCAFANIDSGSNANDDISKLAGHIPDEFAGKIPENAAEEVQKTLKDKCKKVSNSDTAYETAIKAKDKLQECVKSQVNVNELQQEIEDAKSIGDYLDSVLSKYCRKVPVVIDCAKEYLKSVDPCLEEEEKVHKTLLFDLINSIVDFFCYKNGDQIARFIAAGGVACVTERQTGLAACVNQTILAKNISIEIPTVSDPSLVVYKLKCEDFIPLQKCIVDELQKCKELTPANIIESFFKFVHKNLCDFLSGNKSQANTLNAADSRLTILLIGFGVIYKLVLSNN